MLDLFADEKYKAAAKEIYKFHLITGGSFEKSFMFERDLMIARLLRLPFTEKAWNL